MKVVVTGANGTLGGALKKYLEEKNIEVVAWDRREVPIDNYQRMKDFLSHVHPEILFHLAIASQPTGRDNESWMVNYEWTSELAWLSRVLRFKFVYTSTAMIFSDNNKGPFTIDSVPDATQGYGYEKKMSEPRVFYQNPESVVVRLGWQIGGKPEGNTMTHSIEKYMKQNSAYKASIKWFPACSFLEDSADALFRLSSYPPGLYMADSNERWNFYEIACALNESLGSPWKIEPTENFIFDQRMVDPRVEILSLRDRLPSLK